MMKKLKVRKNKTNFTFFFAILILGHGELTRYRWNL